MQVPARNGVTVVPLTPQNIDMPLLKVTLRPELAVALTVPVAPPTTSPVGAVPKLMV